VVSLRLVAAGHTLIGCYELFRSRSHVRLMPTLKITARSDRWFAAIVAAVVTLNLIITIAPSTKIDELHYHMLLPKRVLEDGRLYLYRQPYELANLSPDGVSVGPQYCARGRLPGSRKCAQLGTRCGIDLSSHWRCR
jgi:hypothetical protein